MKPFILSLMLLLSVPAIAEEAVPTTPAAPTEEDILHEKAVRQIVVLVSSQIRPCWKIPATDNNTPLEAIVNIDHSGNLKFVEFTGEVSAGQEALAKSVKDAIADPNCNPIKNLPPQDLYYIWENLPLLFAPKN